MSLKEYKNKRDFNKTSEPDAKTKSSGRKRFVVQYHVASRKHYDLRLEYNGVLISWAVPKGLSINSLDRRLAVMVEDHPVDYINFEGVIPKGNYGAGTVEIFDKGNYMPIGNMKEGLKNGHLKIVLNGEKLKGGWSLIRTDEKNWLIVKLKDEYEGKDLKIKKHLPFKSCEVQLAMLTDKIPSGKDWVFEIKYDGYRMLSFVENGKVKILSRNSVDFTKKFPNIVSALKEIEADNFVIDGEVVAFDEAGRTDFSLLQNKLKRKENDLYYCVFDLLGLNGEDLRKQTLETRKEKLERLLFKSSDYLIYSKHFKNGKETFSFAKAHDLEGVVAKKLSSPYRVKRNSDWLKIKCYLRQEFVIAGYLTSEKNEILSALILGYYSDEELIYVGKVGTGFTESVRVELNKKFQKLKRKNSPFKNVPKLKKAVWLNPKLVAEIQYAELTKDRLLRQPSFIGLRIDKNANDVRLEKAKK